MKKIGFLPKSYIALLIIFMYIPIAVVIIFSFNESKISSVWEGFSLKWYEELFQNEDYFEALINSLVVAASSSLAAAVIGTLGAFGLKRIELRTSAALEYVSTLPIMIPEIILAMGFLVFFSLLGLPFGMTTLIIAHTAFCIPYVFLQVKARLVGLDKSITEAAMDLGASKMRMFVDIVLPLISPAVASGILLSFAMSFDDVIISSFVNGANADTLPLKIYSQLKFGITPEVNALSTLLLVATIILCTLSFLLSRKNRSVKIKKSN